MNNTSVIDAELGALDTPWGNYILVVEWLAYSSNILVYACNALLAIIRLIQYTQYAWYVELRSIQPHIYDVDWLKIYITIQVV